MGDELDLTGDGGVLKAIVRKAKTDAIGPTEELPLVDVHYKVSFRETGEVIYDTHEDRFISFEIGKGDVIKGLDIALSTMKAGEIAKITCQPKYAYESAGSSSEMPPNSTVIFMAELMACRPQGSASPSSSSDYDIPSGEKLKEFYLIAARTAEQAKKFVEQKKEKREDQEEGVVYDLISNGGVTKEIMKKAEADAIGPTEDLPVVDVHYVVSLAETGEVIYDTREERIFSFEIDKDDVIDGLPIALSTMKVGEMAKITCKPEYAYGSAGSPPLIPPNATLIFMAELMACRPRGSASPGSSSDDDIPSVEKMKELYLIAARAAEQENKFVEQKKEMEKIEDQAEGFVYDLTGDGGVTKEIMKKAEADAVGPAEHLQLVDVKCHDCVVVTGTGDTLHYSYEDSPVLNFEMGRFIVIRGWDIALETMKVGEIAKITCKPEYAFGKKESLPDIPPHATVICTLELMSCKDRSIPGSPSDEEERLEWEREAGSELKKWMELDVVEVAEQLGKGAMGAALAARVRARLDAKKNQRKGKRKAELPSPSEC